RLRHASCAVCSSTLPNRSGLCTYRARRTAPCTGHPVEELAKASAHALGLVMGTRGLGGFTGTLLGSVSQGVLHYARCPVIAVPLPGQPAHEHGYASVAR
ncbi:universal stress protein, partial [Streptomyces sp. NPDC059101]|uniref:universal stress protein n=1 Tax=Streptomyces sp. NPDC059101 TaxID=3346728 RepID=UPI0036BED49B